MKKLFAGLLLLGLTAGVAHAAGSADSSDSFFKRIARVLRLRSPGPPDSRASSATAPRVANVVGTINGGTCVCSGGGAGVLAPDDNGQLVCTCCGPTGPPDHEPPDGPSPIHD